MQKLKQYWIIILATLIILVACFYWFQYRPFKARKDCAWKKVHVDAIQYKAAEGSLEQVNLCKRNCDITKGSLSSQILCAYGCEKLYTPEIKAEAEKNWWAQTNTEEYKNCLRGKGF